MNHSSPFKVYVSHYQKAKILERRTRDVHLFVFAIAPVIDQRHSCAVFTRPLHRPIHQLHKLVFNPPYLLQSL